MPKPIPFANPTNSLILDKWLSGTTCYHFNVERKILLENNEFIVLKHASHAGYVDRVSHVKNCSAYAKLYNKSSFTADGQSILSLGRGSIRSWDGRINVKKVREDCLAMGIDFPNELPVYPPIVRKRLPQDPAVEALLSAMQAFRGSK